ncbi:hypothetical protein [Streptomyces sp. NPDC005303]|uniref:hypothetical protein n=1 Tax=Streptomyces sp. NPDC005303 TaxID=3155713 RepID=UPI00339E027C
MPRLSREKKRDQQRGATPIDVRVPLTGESATVAGTPVTAPPGEELHQTVLTHLHHLARTSGHPVHATIHDARIGYVVPLEVATDGASRFTAEPVRMAPPEGGSRNRAAEQGASPAPTPEQGDWPLPSDAGEESAETPWPPAASAPPEGATQLLQALDERGPAPTFRSQDLPEPQPADAEAFPTQVLRQLPNPQPTGSAPLQAPGTAVPPTGEFGPPPVMDASPATTPAPLSPTDLAYTSSPLPEPGPASTPSAPQSGPPRIPGQPQSGPVHTSAPAPDAIALTDLAHTSRPLPQPGAATTPTAPQSGPVHTSASAPDAIALTDLAHTSRPLPQPGAATTPIAPQSGPVHPTPPSEATAPTPRSQPGPGPVPEPIPVPTAGFAAVVPQPLPSASPAPRAAAPFIDPVPLLDDPGPKPTPVRGFDAVAEAVLGEGLVVDESAVLAEPVERISEAVREGRTDVAAELAERVVGEASETLGAEHPDVLRVRELAAYIAYLGGEPVQAAEISLDLADIHHRAGDAEAAYGNVQSAATAWKAVRDPLRGLALGRDLLTLWTDLAAGEGPAAEDPDKLESARARMLRLAERARNADQ